jgi:hypothetical protein
MERALLEDPVISGEVNNKINIKRHKVIECGLD